MAVPPTSTASGKEYDIPDVHQTTRDPDGRHRVWKLCQITNSRKYRTPEVPTLVAESFGRSRDPAYGDHMPGTLLDSGRQPVDVIGDRGHSAFAGAF